MVWSPSSGFKCKMSIYIYSSLWFPKDLFRFVCVYAFLFAIKRDFFYAANFVDLSLSRSIYLHLYLCPFVCECVWHDQTEKFIGLFGVHWIRWKIGTNCDMFFLFSLVLFKSFIRMCDCYGIVLGIHLRRHKFQSKTDISA